MRVRMSQSTFKLIYDGEALKDGEMDVADLAPALLAVGQFIRASAKAAYGEDTTVSVKVKATQEGSFEVLLAMAVDAAGKAWEFWKKDDIQAAAQLAGLLGFSGTAAAGSVIWVVKRLKGSSTKIRSSSEPGSVDLDTPEGVVTVPEAVGKIVVDPAARAALERLVVEPLEKEGIDVVLFGDETGTQRIDEADAVYFRAPPVTSTDEFVSEYVRAFSIMSLHFTAGKKWRLSDGRGAAKLINIEDQDFLGRVARNEERFAKGDILICEVVETSRRTDAGFKSDFEIKRVVEHRPAPVLPQLPLDD